MSKTIIVREFPGRKVTTVIRRQTPRPVDPEIRLRQWLGTLSDSRLGCYLRMQAREVELFPNAAKRLRLKLASELARSRGLTT